MSRNPTDLRPAPELTAGALKNRFPEAFTPRPAVYWADLAESAAIGWGAFYVAGAATPGTLLALGALAVATFGLYRGILFIHELAHLTRGQVPGLNAAWDLLVGIPLGVPSLAYVGSHLAHHRTATYGTVQDPEYAPFAHWSGLRLLVSTLALALVPLFLALRSALLVPLSWACPPLRRLVVARGSTLVVNEAYRRPAPTGRERRRWMLEEIGCALFFWAAGLALYSGALSWHWAVHWYVVGSAILILNHFRTLAAHRYTNEGGRMNRDEQLLDTVNLVGPGWLMGLLAPVGLRYHALHHIAPTLPYHSLGAVHRGLLREMSPESPYRRTLERGMVSALRALVRWDDRVSGGPPDGSVGPGPASRTGAGAGAAAR